ncbi:MAG TPA: malate synthase A, partial [Bacillota bacterium]|nr:malate synthase A [Bacillota bacterium]
MAAHIPVKNDEKKNAVAFEKVRQDKEREARDGHDGTWVAHPGMVSLVKAVFDQQMPTPNQIHRKLEDVHVKEEDLLEVPQGEITEEGLRTNISVGIQYIAAWLKGRGAVPINHLMEDAATAEISRAQVWQWIRHPKGILNDGRKVTLDLAEAVIMEELQKLKDAFGEAEYENGKYEQAAEIFRKLIREDEFVEFLTLPAYEQLEGGNEK